MDIVIQNFPNIVFLYLMNILVFYNQFHIQSNYANFHIDYNYQNTKNINFQREINLQNIKH